MQNRTEHGEKPISNHEYWMRHCLELAQKAKALGEVPVGAVIIDNNEMLLGEGWNQPISSHDPSSHAEIIALRNAANSLQNYRLPNTRLYVTVEPCAMCAGALIHARVKSVIFGAKEPRTGAVCSHLQLFENYGNHHIEYRGGILEKECSTIMQKFFKNKR